jgi:hypothetical protein
MELKITLGNSCSLHEVPVIVILYNEVQKKRVHYVDIQSRLIPHTPSPRRPFLLFLVTYFGWRTSAAAPG